MATPHAQRQEDASELDNGGLAVIEKFDDDGDDESQRILFQPPPPLEISRPKLRTEKPVFYQVMVMIYGIDI